MYGSHDRTTEQSCPQGKLKHIFCGGGEVKVGGFCCVPGKSVVCVSPNMVCEKLSINVSYARELILLSFYLTSV